VPELRVLLVPPDGQRVPLSLEIYRQIVIAHVGKGRVHALDLVSDDHRVFESEQWQ